MSSIEDVQVFRESLIAAAHGPFFPDWEFATLLGLERAEVAAIAAAFSPATLLVGDVATALNGAMNNLLGYPHGQDAVWSQWLSVSPAEMGAVYSKWRASRNEA